MFPYIASYLLIAFTLAVVDSRIDRPLFIRTHSKHFPWKLNFSIKWWGAQEYWAAITLGSIATLAMLALWVDTGGSKVKNIGQVLLVIICLSSSVLSIRHFKLVEKLKAHAWWMTVLTALITVALGLIASAYADSFIVNLTRIDSAQFPVAQKSITTLILISLWAFIATFVISLVVGIVSVIMAGTSPTFIESIKRNPLTAPYWKCYKRGISYNLRSRMLSIVFIGSTFTVVIVLNSWEYILRHTDVTLQETMVFSSFHLHPRDCSIPGRAHDVWAALVSDNRVVIATPSARGYTFETLPCQMQSTKTIERAHLDRLKLDDYF